MALRPFYEDVQAHYDLSDEFYKLFLDRRMVYSCAYFERDGMSLEEAQIAKIDLSLGKCGLKPGMRLLDIGCGWGATALHAAEKYGVRVVGLTLSQNQHAHATALARGRGDVEFRLQGWEDFREPVDAIISIGAFEHFRIERYTDFFGRCHQILPADGRMLLHSIVQGNEQTVEPGLPWVDGDLVRFVKFIQREIFPGGQVPPREVAMQHAIASGFRVTRIQSLRPHYARTLDCWAAALEAAKERAMEIAPPEVFARYERYLTGCAHYFRTGHCDVLQFSLESN
ncbi:MAG: class I SAM-dependent methyltransferase [Planctomycetia bacterium]|nr:class I SAM-dependent methyltransferase [Planctomycetia bacterium]